MSNAETSQTQSVVVIEDDEEISYILNFMLTREGFEVTTASDGKQAVALFEAGPDAKPKPDIVLLDIMLPYVDGIEILRRIRANEGWKDVPIVMLTAKSQESNVLQALEAGANDYITKPFLPAEVLVRLRRFLS